MALAGARRARETPANFDGRKAQVGVLLGKHEFARALDLAKMLDREVPADVLVYGLLGDAHMELGDDKDAIGSSTSSLTSTSSRARRSQPRSATRRRASRSTRRSRSACGIPGSCDTRG